MGHTNEDVKVLIDIAAYNKMKSELRDFRENFHFKVTTANSKNLKLAAKWEANLIKLKEDGIVEIQERHYMGGEIIKTITFIKASDEMKKLRMKRYCLNHINLQNIKKKEEKSLVGGIYGIG